MSGCSKKPQKIFSTFWDESLCHAWKYRMHSLRKALQGELQLLCISSINTVGFRAFWLPQDTSFSPGWIPACWYLSSPRVTPSMFKQNIQYMLFLLKMRCNNQFSCYHSFQVLPPWVQQFGNIKKPPLSIFPKAWTIPPSTTQNSVLNMDMKSPMFRQEGVQLSRFGFLVQETFFWITEKTWTVLKTPGFKSHWNFHVFSCTLVSLQLK